MKPDVVGISGFLVVRMPRQNFDAAGRGAFRSAPPCINGVCYSGLDRMPWFDVDEASYQHILPDPLARAREAIRKATGDFTGVQFCRDLEVAMRLLGFSNSSGPRNELIVARSPKLAEIKGEFEVDGSLVTWLGYDAFSLGHWSLVAEGVFVKPGIFPPWQQLLNDHGLLRSLDAAAGYVDAYHAASQQGLLEELPEEVYGTDVIEVGRVTQ